MKFPVVLVVVACVVGFSEVSEFVRLVKFTLLVLQSSKIHLCAIKIHTYEAYSISRIFLRKEYCNNWINQRKTSRNVWIFFIELKFNISASICNKNNSTYAHSLMSCSKLLQRNRIFSEYYSRCWKWALGVKPSNKTLNVKACSLTLELWWLLCKICSFRSSAFRCSL